MSYNHSAGNSDKRSALSLPGPWRGLLLVVALVLPILGLAVPFVNADTPKSSSQQDKLAGTPLSMMESAVADKHISRGMKEADDRISSSFSTDKERNEATTKLFEELENKGLMPEVIEQFVLERFGRFDQNQNKFIAPAEIRQVLEDKSAVFLSRTQKSLVEYIERHSLSIARCVNDETSFEDCISKADLAAYNKNMAENVASMSTASGKHSGKMTVEGAARSYDIYVPASYDGKTAVPLVIALHGAFENAAMMESRTGFNAKADKEGFIVIYPEARACVSGRGRTWNVGSSVWWGVDDVEYVEMVIKSARQKFNVDSKMIYVAGFSNGAMLAHEVGTRLSHVVAGVAAVSGSLNGSENVPAQPISVIIIHGTKDELVPIEGRQCFTGYWFFTMKSAEEARKFWSKNCKADTLVPSKAASGYKEELYQSADGKIAVAQYSITGGTHTWPGGGIGSAGANQVLNATDTIWAFFKSHPKP